MRSAPLLGLSLLTLTLPALLHASSPAQPPAQPASGPGGADTRFGGVTQRRYGMGNDAYTIFAPSDPTPAQAPVVVFTHGWGAVAPATYYGWIQHLVRHEGVIVIYPQYQANLRTPPASFLPNAVGAVRDALARLRSGTLGVRPQESCGAYIGHSAGGLLAASLAAVARKEGLPTPRAVVCVEPGGGEGMPRFRIPLEDMSQVPEGTLLLTLVGDRDRLAGDRDARRIYKETSRIRKADKNFVTLRSDDHGAPALLADHVAPTSGPGQADALDYYGTWKLSDALMEAGFFGKSRAYALGDTSQQRFMGKWSDGVPVKPLVVSDPN